MLGTVAVEGGENFGERGEAIGVILGVAGTVVAGILHGGPVPLVLGVLFNPKAFELMPLDKGGVWVESRVFTEFILELVCILDAGKCRFN